MDLSAAIHLHQATQVVEGLFILVPEVGSIILIAKEIKLTLKRINKHSMSLSCNYQFKLKNMERLEDSLHGGEDNEISWFIKN